MAESKAGGSVHFRLFQASMWRDYAMQWDSPYYRNWCRDILQLSREECLRRARINVYLAKRANRRIQNGRE